MKQREDYRQRKIVKWVKPATPVGSANVYAHTHGSSRKPMAQKNLNPLFVSCLTDS
jgi:hypothetical protein